LRGAAPIKGTSGWPAAGRPYRAGTQIAPGTGARRAAPQCRAFYRRGQGRLQDGCDDGNKNDAPALRRDA
jgi:hypothetical protein